MSKKIILLCSGLKRAGQEKVVYELALGFISNGFKVSVVSFYGGPYKLMLEKENIPVTLLVKEGQKNSLTSKFMLFSSFFKFIKKNKEASFIIHGLGFENLWLAASILFNRLPFSIFVFHNNYPLLESIGFNLKKYRLKLFLKNIKKHVYIKQNILNTALKTRIVKNNDKAVVIENGIAPPKKINSIAEKITLKSNLGFNKQDVVLFQVGRFVTQKNQLLTIRALQLLKKDFLDIKLVFAGNGPLLKECKELTKNLDLEKEIIFLGNIPNVHDYLNIADLFLLPSSFEGHPIALIEAMMLDLPNVVFKSPGIFDFLPEDFNGLNYAKQNDYKSLSAEIKKVLLAKEEILNSEKFHKSNTWVKQMYSREMMVSKYQELI